ncbi:hypothetical protein FALBO_13086 [Fusarium albosuccineum]|uniref:Uncharacterized protein n=1 Tax=Fusarium albosuccineum TaxID=1237068 RepID=A0A8H4P7E8_9HYPO|nr:hypothetical protein FALBO_13086 [Fusarium albosuccineum]
MKLSTTLAFASSLTTVIAQDISTSFKCFTTTILPTTTLYSYQGDTNPTDIALHPTGNPQTPVPQFDQPNSATAKSDSLHDGASSNSAIPNGSTPKGATLGGASLNDAPPNSSDTGSPNGAAAAGPSPSEVFRDSGVSNDASPNSGSPPDDLSHNDIIPSGKAEGSGPSRPDATPDATPETFIVSGSSRIDVSVALLGLIGFFFI